MRIVFAIQTLWGALRYPTSTSIPNSGIAVSIFALSILLLTAVQTFTTSFEAQNRAIAAESEQSSIIELLRKQDTSTTAPIQTETPQRAFTAQLGVVLITTIIGFALAAGLFTLLTPFLTNQPVNYVVAVGACSATVLIELFRLLLYFLIHMATGSVQYGIHAGAFVSVVDHPFLFTWLTKIDPFVWWQYVVMGMVLSNSIGLHFRYGYVIGTIVYGVLLAAIGSLALFAFISVSAI